MAGQRSLRRPWRHRPWATILLSVLLFALLQLAWQLLDGTLVSRILIDGTVVRPAAFLINVVTPSAQAKVVGYSIVTPVGIGIRIMNGCEGVEMVFLLLASFAVAPLPWATRGLAMLMGMPLVFVANELRILALFYANRLNDRLFDELHGVVCPILMIVLMSLYAYAWFVNTRGRHAAAA